MLAPLGRNQYYAQITPSSMGGFGAHAASKSNQCGDEDEPTKTHMKCSGFTGGSANAEGRASSGSKR